VDDRRTDPATGERVQFQSVILPRWCRRSPKVAEVLPLLYLHGLSSLDFVPALEGRCCVRDDRLQPARLPA
jgi:putative transposase